MRTLRIFLGLLMTGTAWAQYLISTVAGGAPPPSPAPGLTLIRPPDGMATDSAGNAYFTSLNCVFKLDLTGLVTRIAGTSRLGYSGDGGAATLAQLNNPNGVAVDSAGNVFIADAGNSRVRKISNGTITTVAGDNNYGFSGDGGPTANASLYAPQGVAVDGQGNVIISDTNNNRVRKVSTSGVISTLAGTGTAGFSGDGGLAANAQLKNPQGVAVDSSGNVYIVDSDNSRVRRVSLAGVITTVAGSSASGFFGDGGPATSAQLNGPLGVAVDSANDIFIADYYTGRVREVLANGTINTVVGSGANYSGDNGPATSAQTSAGGVAADGSGNFYIADNSGVRKISANGIITTIAGTGVCCGPGPSGVAATSAQISPERVALDGSGNLFISDYFSIVHKVSANGIITTVAGNATAGFSGDGGQAASAQLALAPGGLAIDTSGNLYIADTNNNRIRKVSTNGIITTVAGNGTAGFAGDGGLATAAQLSEPFSVAVDASGNLYIVDFHNSRIRKVAASSGIITTLAGNGTGGYSGDGGPAASAALYGPGGVAVDRQGNVFIADSFNNRIRKVSTDGIITTVAGNGGYGYSGDCGPATSAQLAYENDVAVDGLGNIYISDTGNNAVRRLQPTTKPTLVCAVADAASEGLGPVSPGKIVVIYGTGLGSSPISYTAPANGIFGTQLAGTSVSVNGVAAPLIYTLPGQVSAIVPYETTGAAAQFAVSYQGQTSTFAAPVAAVAPSLFTANSSGVGQAAAINNVDGSYNSASNPVAIGGYIQLYATGEGQTSPAGVDGSVAALAPPLPAPVLAVTATVGGLPAVVEYAGAAPGSVAGLMQVNVQIPAGVQPGSQVPVVITVGTASTGPGVLIALAGN